MISKFTRLFTSDTHAYFHVGVAERIYVMQNRRIITWKTNEPDRKKKFIEDVTSRSKVQIGI